MERNNERTYEFISDPTHKINLSGRVSAACANCRRKKIKCDGTTNCRQCLEKNLECIPAPSRKRPKRDRNISSGEASSSGAIATNIALIHSAPARLSAQGSSKSGVNPSSRPNINPLQSHTPSDDATSGAELSPNASSSSAERRISRSISPLDRSVTAFVHPRLHAPIGGPPLQDGRSSREVEWPVHRSAPDVLSGAASGQQGTPADLRTAAQALEDEAHSLRQLASSRDGFHRPSNASVPMQEPSPGPHVGSIQQPFAMSPPEQSASFRSGLTPLMSDYSNWWTMQTAGAPYQPVEPYLPATQAETTAFQGQASYGHPQQDGEEGPDQRDPPWSRRA